MWMETHDREQKINAQKDKKDYFFLTYKKNNVPPSMIQKLPVCKINLKQQQKTCQKPLRFHDHFTRNNRDKKMNAKQQKVHKLYKL